MSVLLSIFFFIFLILILLEHPEILFSKKKNGSLLLFGLSFQIRSIEFFFS